MKELSEIFSGLNIIFLSFYEGVNETGGAEEVSPASWERLRRKVK